MLQMSKITQSRDEWKHKAVQRASTIRKNRKQKKYTQEKIAKLKKKIEFLEQADEGKKNSLSRPPKLLT